MSGIMLRIIPYAVLSTSLV